MNPYTGTAHLLREELFGDAKPGASLDMYEFTKKVEALEDATADELAATKAEALVAITGQAAQKLILGEREQERRKRRRKSAKAARRLNR